MRWLLRASVRTQIAVLTVVLAFAVTIAAECLQPAAMGPVDRGIRIGLIAGRIERVLAEFNAADTPDGRAAALALAGTLGLAVVDAAPDQLAHDPVSGPDVSRDLRHLLDLDVFHDPTALFRSRPTRLIVPARNGAFLSFTLPDIPMSRWAFPAVATYLVLILIPAILLGYLVAWVVGRPLVRFAAAAERVSLDDTLEEPFKAEGAAEIRSLAGSLNTMRRRVLDLVGARTRMLSSISHDLRTPLTRLRMRAERCEPPELRLHMLRDIETLSGMVDESLAYLSNTLETTRKVELSSLLQTVADDFAETGVNVTFEGPRRVIYECKPRSISRAISNLVDNAWRHAEKVEIALELERDGTVLITVADDGPGLPDKLKKKVLEPFFKADDARPVTTGSGFGLGLPIAHGIITLGHGGTFELVDRQPAGLTAVMRLPPHPVASAFPLQAQPG